MWLCETAYIQKRPQLKTKCILYVCIWLFSKMYFLKFSLASVGNVSNVLQAHVGWGTFGCTKAGLIRNSLGVLYDTNIQSYIIWLYRLGRPDIAKWFNGCYVHFHLCIISSISFETYKHNPSTARQLWSIFPVSSASSLASLPLKHRPIKVRLSYLSPHTHDK